MLIWETLVHWIHLMSAAFWVGGMLFLTLVVSPVLRREAPPEARGTLVKSIGRGFQRFGWIALALLFVTGTVKISQVWTTLEWGSSLGVALALKLTLFIGMVLLSVLHDFTWAPRVEKFRSAGQPEQALQASRTLVFWARFNLSLAVVIVFLGAFIRMNPF